MKVSNEVRGYFIFSVMALSVIAMKLNFKLVPCLYCAIEMIARC